MRKVIVYAAVSLDGFIADSSGGVGWLEQPEGTARDDGYSRFIETVDTVVMGARTYRQVVTELSPEAWPYRGLTTYVLTHTPDNAAPQADIRFVSRPPASLLEELVNLPGKDIWICGGADIVRQCRETDRIDEYQLAVMPVLLGEGIPLFAPARRRDELVLQSVQEENGAAFCIFRRRR